MVQELGNARLRNQLIGLLNVQAGKTPPVDSKPQRRERLLITELGMGLNHALAC